MTAAPAAVRPLPLAPRARFCARFRRGMALSGMLIFGTLAVGTLGYHSIVGFAWPDAFHQASMLLAAMKPVRDVTTDAGKLFSSVHALFCGVTLIGATGSVFPPVNHRILHRFHSEDATPDK
ncbi:MAG TPA: hypothetical protein VIK97_07635 [Casimicrobiaceae bacterium]